MAKGLFTALFNALSDPKSYYAMQKEMNMKAVAETYFNVLAGKTVFEAYILPESMENPQVKFDGKTIIRVRPLGIYDFIIPEPCTFKDKETQQRILSLHPVAYPDYDSGIAIPEARLISAPQVVECYFKDGPQSNGRLRGLTYRQKTKRKTPPPGVNYDCLFGASNSPTANAFDGGGYVPNLASQGQVTPGTVDKRMESQFYIPPFLKGTRERKHIVIHYGGTNNPLGDQKYGAKKPTPAAYHYGVSRKGEVYYFNDNENCIYHASNFYMNSHSIGINFANRGYAREGVPASPDWIKGTNKYGGGGEKLWQPYTNAQYQKGSKLLAELCKKFNLDPTGINKDNGHPTIIGHDYVTANVANSRSDTRPLNKIDPGRSKSDPGPAFSMEGIRKLAKSKMN
jgi:N-acetyl-anhydromuramyl-L-alanine amidase AmpD